MIWMEEREREREMGGDRRVGSWGHFGIHAEKKGRSCVDQGRKCMSRTNDE